MMAALRSLRRLPCDYTDAHHHQVLECYWSPGSGVNPSWNPTWENSTFAEIQGKHNYYVDISPCHAEDPGNLHLTLSAAGISLLL